MNLKEEYSGKKKEIKRRLDDFARVKDKDIFYELCFCICTPQSNAKRCNKAVEILKQKDFLNKNIQPDLTGVRFHNNKARYLLEAKKKYSYIEKELKQKDAYLLREYLVKSIKGLGLKEASHFLRNIGYRNLAILDRHILRNLVRFNVIKEIPNLTPKNYLEIESKFQNFAKKQNIPMDELDLLFWSMQTGEIFK